MTRPILITEIASPVGDLLAGSNEKGICFLEFTDKDSIEKHKKKLEKKFKASLVSGQNAYLKKLKLQLAEYFEGKRKDFDVPLDIFGSYFQKSVWKALSEIPYGETNSYQEQAIRIGNKKAVRAVANANGANNVVIVIPCHRVIGKDGSLTGFGGGVWRKKFLLDLEKNNSN